MLDGLDDIAWDELEHGRGYATDIPLQLRDYVHAEGERRRELISDWYGTIRIENSRFPASAAALPFIAELAELPGGPERADLVRLLVELLTGFPDEYLFDAFDLSEDDDLGARLAAAYERVVPVLRRLAVDEDPVVRAAAAYALAWHRDDRAASVALVERRLAVETDAPTRFCLFLALSYLDDGPATRAVLTAALGGDRPLSERFAGALGLARVTGEACPAEAVAVLAEVSASRPQWWDAAAWEAGQLPELADEALLEVGAPIPQSAASVAPATSPQPAAEPGRPAAQPPAPATFSAGLVQCWRPDGPSVAVATDSHLYLAGEFDTLVPARPSCVVLGPDWRTVGDGPDFATRPKPLLAAEDGTFYAAGRLHGSDHATMVRLHPDGTLDDGFRCRFGTDPPTRWDNHVHAFAWYDGVLYVLGQFSRLDGEPVEPFDGLVAVDARTGADTGLRVAAPAGKLAVNDARIFVYGQFSRLDGVAVAGIAAFDRHTGALLDWRPETDDDWWLTPSTQSGAPRCEVTNLVIDGDTGYAGVQPIFGPHTVHAVDLATGRVSWRTKDIGRLLSVHDGSLYLVDADAIVRADPATGQRIATIPVGGEISDVFVGGSRILVYHWADREKGQRMAELATAGERQGTMSTLPLAVRHNHPLLAIGSRAALMTADQVLADGVPRHGLAAVDLASGTPIDVPVTVDGTVSSLARAPGGRLLLFGAFGRVGDQPRAGTAAVDPATWRLDDWQPRFNNTVTVARFDPAGNRLYLGGQFTEVDGQPRRYAAAFDATSGALLPWRVTLDGEVTDLDPDGERVWLIGRFRRVGKEKYAGLVAVDTGRGSPAGWQPGPELGRVTCAALAGSWLVLGGNLHGIDGAPPRDIAAFDRATGAAIDWDPRFDAQGRPDIQRVQAWQDTLWVSGNFVAANGHDRPGVAVFGLPGGTLLDWCPPPDLLPTGRLLPISDDRAVLLGKLFHGHSPFGHSRLGYALLRRR